ncbi:pannexin 10 [Plakobranchus ocellatus]|uniref:Pannexin 10 n=1 Tax=Plakobranchus ocellatus TaxID=259542 RepID=A0AAV3XV19_9GAST|nr:pannexin 10 [Plakobranchus ocellatus]
MIMMIRQKLMSLQTVEGSSAGHGARAHLVQSEPDLSYKAKCRCPVQITDNMVEHMNAVCGAAFNLRISGIDPATRGLGVSLFDIPFSELSPVSADDLKDKEFMPGVSNETQDETPAVNVKTPTQKESSEFFRLKQEKTDKAWHFIHVKTPFVLFLFAICLTIPYLVWTLMSGIVGGVDVDNTLLSAKTAGQLDHDSRRRLWNELAHAAGESLSVCSWMVSAHYLLLKLLVCAAVLAELFVAHTSQSGGGGARTRHKRVPAGFMASSLSSVPPTSLLAKTSRENMEQTLAIKLLHSNLFSTNPHIAAVPILMAL